MAPVHPGVICYSHNKSCFLSVPKSIVNPSIQFQGLHVFKIEYGKNQKAYFSCYGDSVSQSGEAENVIKLNGKFALTLGLREKEQVLIEQVEKCSVHVERMYLEPLNSDDWEVMELNADVVEIQLLSQIRTVWKDQVFPVWVNKVSFFVRVSKLVPDAEPALLMEWTLIHVTSKERNSNESPDVSGLPKKQKNKYKQFQHLRKRGRQSKLHDSSTASVTSDDSELSNQSSYLQTAKPSFSILRYLMKSTFQNEASVSSSLKTNFPENEFHPLNLDFPLRVISFSKGNSRASPLPCVFQATTVFISSRTFLAHCKSDIVPSCFVARLTKILSPQQKKDLADAELRDSKAASSKSKKKETKPENDSKWQTLCSVCVNVIVLKSSEEEFDVPEALFRSTDFIAVPLELKRRLSLEVSSRIRCQSVDVPPISFDNIILHPLEKLHIVLDDNLVVSEFHKWFEGENTNESSIVLCDGTLVKLPVNKGRTCDFAVILAEADGTEQNSLLSSSLSPTSGSESDKSISSVSLAPCYGFLNKSKLKRMVIKLGAYSSHMRKSVWIPGASYLKIENLYQSVPHLSLEALGGIEKISQKARANLEMWFKLRPMYYMNTIPYFKVCGSMLIHGPKGIGKSTLVQALCKKLINYPEFIHTCVIKCLPLRGKRVETIARKWEMAFSECIHRQPSLLVFDDLDHLASSVTTLEQDSGPDGIYYMNIVQVFIGILEKIIVNNYNIGIVATSKSSRSIHPVLMRTKGRRIFHTILGMELPNADQRSEILQSLIMSKLHISSDSISSLRWKIISAKTEGFVAQDLVTLLDRATHAAWVRTKYRPQERNDENQVVLVEEDFEIALSGYVPATLRGVQLQKRSNRMWKDVGGLHEVKKVIHQVLKWPTKYKSLYRNYGLKPQRNILLYGAPGTGKTLIAGVVAGECDVNFINIKGPELLSKYIGASEQSVRDLFNRAMVAKPCVLFFDEFDALVPRRGHDNTGVTDRVVNQFLTQMDGVEAMEGVYVLAATSRPELIDPALLRPGRLDKCLYCPLPDENDRLEILGALSGKLSLADDVDFKIIAARTENFSGADLQALLYSAQVKAFHDNEHKRTRRYSTTVKVDVDFTKAIEKLIYMPSVERGVCDPSEAESRMVMEELDALLCNMDNLESPSRGRRHSTISTEIEQKHLIEVLSEMKPSVSAEERLRYLMTFEQFQEKRGTDFGLMFSGQAKRVTLA